MKLGIVDRGVKKLLESWLSEIDIIVQRYRMAKSAKRSSKSAKMSSRSVAAKKTKSGHTVLGRTSDGVWLIRPSVKPTISRQKLRSAVTRVLSSR
jgi:hypothetical protein